MTGPGDTCGRMGAVLIAFLLLGPAPPAGASLDQDRLDCNDAGARSTVQIDACTRLIQSERFKGPALANAFYNRAIAHGAKGEFGRAIKDYSRAIGLKPRFAEAFYNRGLAYGKNGQFERAIGDFKKAYALGNRNPFLLEKLKKHGALP